MFNIRKGFTLIEMIAVLALLLILAAIAVPSFVTAIDGTRDQSAVLSAEALAGSIDANAAIAQVAPEAYVADLADFATSTVYTEWDNPGKVTAVYTEATDTIVVSVDGGAAGTADDSTATIALGQSTGAPSTVS